jgi:hypothetical protein
MAHGVRLNCLLENPKNIIYVGMHYSRHTHTPLSPKTKTAAKSRVMDPEIICSRSDSAESSDPILSIQ